MASVKELQKIANQLRIDLIKMIGEAGSGHPGGSLSSIDIITTLFFHEMNHRPREPKWSERDRFVLSKGHACPALYAALAHAGYFDKSVLKTLRKLESPLQGHPDPGKLPYLEAATGSLGQGLSVAQGIALAAKVDKKSWRCFCIIGDGETQEGQIWETAMSAPKFKLDNLIAFTDYNHGQIDGTTETVMPIEPLADKWKAFNWHVQSIDGHNFASIIEAIENTKRVKEKPHMIIANTEKGHGVSFMKGINWHGKAPDKEQAAKAITELEELGRKLNG